MTSAPCSRFLSRKPGTADAFDDYGVNRTPTFGVDRRKRDSAKILLKSPVTVDTVNLSRAL